MTAPCISVVVLTHNRRDTLAHTLRQLTALPERPRVAVVDNGSTDGTCAMLARQFPEVACLSCSTNLGAAGRNLGAQWASTPYVAFCDDDCWWQAGALARACAMFDKNPEIGALTARILVGESEREDPTSTAMSHSPLPSAGLPGRMILGVMAGATAFRTGAFLEAGGYDSRLFIGGEETLLSLRLAALGWALVYAPELVVHHHPSAARDAQRRRAMLARNAVWSAWLCLPAPMAVAETLGVLPQLATQLEPSDWGDLLRGMRWVLQERQVVPRHIAAALRLVRAAAR